MSLRHPASLSHVGVLTPATWKRYSIGALFVALYAISLQRWYLSAGQPHEWALEEQKRTLREKAAIAKEKGVSFTSGKQDRKETELDIDQESLPSPLLPDAWACALIFLTISSHILFHLVCVWSISFKAFCLYQPSKSMRAGCFVRVTPHANKGKADICRVEESEVTLRLTFTFQYQNFEHVEPGEEDADLIGDVSTSGVRLIQCPIHLRWQDYQQAEGLKTEGEIEKAQDKFGANIFELPRPSFWKLYQKQLMSPIAMFQFFCTALWMLDTYWKYTCFTLMSILGFEASTAFQRLKSISTLRGMSTKSYTVYVYRQNKWEERTIEELLPGDVISLTAKKPDPVSAAPEEGEQPPQEQTYLTIPCDCLVLRGSAIVNEASLTGESVPQMKDAMGTMADDTIQVDVFGKHRVHALFSGTLLIQATPGMKSLEGTDVGTSTAVLDPPNDGIVCFVLRTGFNSSQGELMRMIEFSTQDVSADTIETCLQLLFLLCFALVAAGYVLKKGLEDASRPTYKTLLRCTLIITSVVPPSLPMQMAFAVHTALMSLLRIGIFCTEPFRVPYAGRVNYCFFDKTGTLTSDQMVAIGVVNCSGSEKNQNAKPCELTPVKEASTMTAMVVAGCHSLIEVDGKALGDPIEVAALQGVGWSYVPTTSTSSPGTWRMREKFIAKQRQFVATLRDEIESDKKEKEELNKKIEDLEKTLKQERQESKKVQCQIEQRFHFSSELQRMSTICRVTSTMNDKVPTGTYCLTKGSPEAIARLLASKPEWYEPTYRKLAENGQ